MIFAIIGKITVWFIGLAAAFYLPFLVTAFVTRNQEGIGGALAGMCLGLLGEALYVIGSFIYFAAT